MTKMLAIGVTVLAMTVAAGGGVAAAVEGSAPGDELIGKWFGTTGPPQDRIETGFELKRNDEGRIKAYLYRPVMSWFGLEMPGEVVKDGDRYVMTELKASAVLRGDTLEITRADGSSYALRRVASLPVEAPVGDFPRGPGPKWQVKLGGPIYAPAALFDGHAYVGTTQGVLNAVSLRDGSFVWGFEAGRPIHGEALATKDAVFFVCDNGFLFKLDRETGKELWRYDIGDAQVARNTQIVNVYGYDFHAPRPALADGVVYAGSGDGSLHAVDAASGKRVWRFAGQGKVRSNPLVHGRLVVFGTLDGLLYAVDRGSGKAVWQQQLSLDVTGSPAMVGDRLIVGSRGSVLYALAPTSGETLWTQSFWGSWVESTAVPYGPLFYIGSSDLRRVACYDPADGRVVWRTDVYGSPWGRPVVTDKHVYIGAEGNAPYAVRMLGSFTALDRQSGRIAWRWPLPELPGVVQTGFAAGPTLAGDTVVIGGLDGSLYAFPAE